MRSACSFQLALTAPPPDGRLSYTVFNGKKLRDYTYDVRGEEMLETALGALRTLHLARVVNGDGRFEIWLAIDRYYLPVRMLRSDDKAAKWNSASCRSRPESGYCEAGRSPARPR